MIELTEDGEYKWLNPTEEELAELSHMLELNTSEKEKKLNNLVVEEAFLELAGEGLSFEEVARYTCNELVIRYLLSQDRKYAKYVLKNPECPEWLFEDVVNCPDIYDSSFRFVAVHAAKCSKMLLEKMLNDENNRVKKAAKKRLRNIDGKQDFANWLFLGNLGGVILFFVTVFSIISILCLRDSMSICIHLVNCIIFILSMFMIGLRSIFFNDPGMLTGIYW